MLRVMVIFGGRSGEHEVSLASARAIIEALKNSGRYELVPAGITRQGHWLTGGDPLEELETEARGTLGTVAPEPPAGASEKLPPTLSDVDVVFPVLHGPYGEDGTVQGALELAGVPYVGSGVLASAVGMDKITMKKIFAFHSLPQVDWVGLTRKEWQAEPGKWLKQIENSLGYPCFIKPSNMGSSVGISKADSTEGLKAGLDEAAELDRRIIVEKGVHAREIEISVMGNETPKVSVPGEIVVSAHDFYNYEAKYTAGESELIAPAPIPGGTAMEIQQIARTAYRAIDAAGMARVDFFLEHDSGKLLLNEINTIPGFTPTSVYARLWAASGLPYQALLDELIKLALERHAS